MPPRSTRYCPHVQPAGSTSGLWPRTGHHSKRERHDRDRRDDRPDGRSRPHRSRRSNWRPDRGVRPSVTDQAKEKVQETAQGVQQKAQEVKGQAGDRVRQEVEKHSMQTGSQLLSTADAMRRTGEQLQQEGKDGPAKMTNVVAERAERLGSYMTAANNRPDPEGRRGLRPSPAVARRDRGHDPRFPGLPLHEGLEQQAVRGRRRPVLRAALHVAGNASCVVSTLAVRLRQPRFAETSGDRPSDAAGSADGDEAGRGREWRIKARLTVSISRDGKGWIAQEW